MWATSRRTGLFIVSYAPLATMFCVLKWPTGWQPVALLRLAIWILGVASLLMLPSIVVAVTGRVARWVFGGVLLVAAAVVAVGSLRGWLAPLTTRPPSGRTSGAAASVGFGFAVLGVMIVRLLVYNARRAGAVRWTVADPRDQGGAVAGYLATYLLPLLSVGAGGWRVTAAYGIYVLALYVVYLQSDGLVLINPTLYLFRYRIYDVQVDAELEEDRRRVLLLTKLHITAKMEVHVLPLGDECYLATPAPPA